MNKFEQEYLKIITEWNSNLLLEANLKSLIPLIQDNLLMGQTYQNLNDEEKKGLEIIEEDAFDSEISDEELQQFYEDNQDAIDLLGGLDMFEALLELSDEEFFYYWLDPAGRDEKIYWQCKQVHYADYKRDFYYISPDLLIPFDTKELF